MWAVVEEEDDRDIFEAMDEFERKLVHTRADAEWAVHFVQSMRNLVAYPKPWSTADSGLAEVEPDFRDFLADVRTIAADPVLRSRAACVWDLWIIRVRLEWGLA